jgi:hypothetical protein
MIIVLETLHVVFANSIYKAGGFSVRNPLSYVVIGGFLLLVAFKVRYLGSARESVEMYDWRGFGTLPQFDSRSRRRCGNVETRVLCGFPSSEGGRTVVAECSIIPPSERHFHSEARFIGHLQSICCLGGRWSEIGTFQKAA